MTRFLLVDDHAVVREGLKRILEAAFPGVVFGEAASGEEAMRKALAADWEIIVLDVSLPDRSGLDVMKEIRKTRSDLPVLFLSMYPEEQFAIRALRAGASGYVTKKTASADLVLAVKKILAGGRFVSPSLADALAGEIARGPEIAPHLRLSDREYEVFRLLAFGKTVGAVATELSLTPQTISTHRSRILQKMNMSENAELTLYAVRYRLLE